MHPHSISTHKSQPTSNLTKKYLTKPHKIVPCRMSLKIYGGIWIPKIIHKTSWKNNASPSWTEIIPTNINIDSLYFRVFTSNFIDVPLLVMR